MHKKMYLSQKRLGYKLIIGFCLMSIIPLLICVYFITNYILPNVRNVWEMNVVVLIAAAITVIGYHLVREIIVSIIKISQDIRLIAEGNSNHLIEEDRDDEIGRLISSVNIITKRLKEKIEEFTSLKGVAESLKIKDDLTNLYNERYIKNRLAEEIKRAIIYQRPCSFLIFNIDNFKRYAELYGELTAEMALKRIARIFSESITDIDRAARLGEDEFAILMPEKNKRQALQMAEDMRNRVEFSFKNESDPSKHLTVSGGISENPIDGTTSEEIFSKAKTALVCAKSGGKNKVVG